jgi:hypothetical protein
VKWPLRGADLREITHLLKRDLDIQYERSNVRIWHRAARNMWAAQHRAEFKKRLKRLRDPFVCELLSAAKE